MRCKRAISDPPMSAAACRRITALASLVLNLNDNRVPARGKSILELRQAPVRPYRSPYRPAWTPGVRRPATGGVGSVRGRFIEGRASPQGAARLVSAYPDADRLAIASLQTAAVNRSQMDAARDRSRPRPVLTASGARTLGLAVAIW